MTTLTKTQETILQSATDRHDGSIHPLPKRIHGGAAKKVIDSLRAKGLITDAETISPAGFIAIGMKPSLDAIETPAESAPTPVTMKKAEAKSAFPTYAEIVGEAGRKALGLEALVKTEPAEVNTTHGAPPAPVARENSKKAKVIELLKRPEGATAAQIAEATGWQNHTIRGFLSIARSKLGLNINTHSTRMVEPNKQGRSYTTYFAK